jgi:hypothetical protein
MRFVRPEKYLLVIEPAADESDATEHGEIAAYRHHTLPN